MTFTRVSLITAVLCIAPTVHAAAAALPESLRACRSLQDSLQRLVCYDREIAAQDAAVGTAAAPAAPAASVAPAAPVAAAPAAAAPGVAAAAPQLGDELVSRKARPAKGSTEASLTAGVTALREDHRGTWVISLDNGQVWRQQEVGLPFPLRTGETVRIDKGVLGSYMLTRVVEGWTRWIRVTRVK